MRSRRSGNSVGKVAWSSVSRWVGSLQLAVGLLALFAAALFLGTLLESWYDREMAVQLVYQTWWFLLLLGLLGANILFAALKKWPWKRHQTGFLITHVGLLTLVTGGFLSGLTGLSGRMMLVDSDDAAASRFGPQVSNRVVDHESPFINVCHASAPRGEESRVIASRRFSPGPFGWSVNDVAKERPPDDVDAFTSLLGWLARPGRRGWRMPLPGSAELEILRYYPRARRLPFVAGTPRDEGTLPALKLQLASSATGLLPERWLADREGDQLLRIGPSRIEFLGRDCRPEQLREFAQPSPNAERGSCGVLVLAVNGQVSRVPVQSLLDAKRLPLKASGWQLELIEYLPNFLNADDKLPANPGVSFWLLAPDGAKTGFAVTGRQPTRLLPLPNESRALPELRDVWAWYHSPDERFGDPAVLASLQFVLGADGQLAYRSFAQAEAGELTLEHSGRVTAGEPVRIWKAMNWRVRVTEFLPHAIPGRHFVSVGRSEPSAAMGPLVPAIRCRLAKHGTGQTFWVGKSENDLSEPVTIGGETYQVGFNSLVRELDFSLTLRRAEQAAEPGSTTAGMQRSYVLLDDARSGVKTEPRLITMNLPLIHRGYRFYQSTYERLGVDARGRPISRSVLLVGLDPGLSFKYVGSSMVALGIACMFYMRAYSRRGQK